MAECTNVCCIGLQVLETCAINTETLLHDLPYVHRRASAVLSTQDVSTAFHIFSQSDAHVVLIDHSSQAKVERCWSLMLAFNTSAKYRNVSEPVHVARSGFLHVVAVANGKDLVAPFNVVITGSTKGKLLQPAASGRHAQPAIRLLMTACNAGIGRALANNFVLAGDNVLICSRSGILPSASVMHAAQAAQPCFSTQTTKCALRSLSSRLSAKSDN